MAESHCTVLYCGQQGEKITQQGVFSPPPLLSHSHNITWTTLSEQSERSGDTQDGRTEVCVRAHTCWSAWTKSVLRQQKLYKRKKIWLRSVFFYSLLWFKAVNLLYQYFSRFFLSLWAHGKVPGSRVVVSCHRQTEKEGMMGGRTSVTANYV